MKEIDTKRTGMSPQEHVHSFVRYKKTKNAIYYKCNDPYCTTVFDRELLVGKASRCSCTNIFILDREQLKRAVPKCLDCRNTKEAILHKRAKQLVGQLIVGDQNE